MKTRLRTMETGVLAERTFGSDDRIQDVRIETRRVQYLYSDGNLYYFMDLETYEQPALPASALEYVKSYLVENMELGLALYEGRAVEIDSPNSVDLAVADTPPPHKGDTSSGGTKPATLENGMVIQVPFFIAQGDKVRVDTRTGEYMTRVRE